MTTSFAVRHALREARSGMRRFGMYTAAITLGVAALVAINAYRANIVDAVRTDAQRLLGGDVRLQSDSPFPDSVGALLDSLTQSGARVAHVTATLSMGTIRPLSAPDSGGARLVQLRAIDSPYPFYDEWRTTPPAAWPPPAEHREALVEPSLLLQADAQIGDSVQLGRARFRIAGTVDNLPGELGFRGAAGPRVYIARAHLEETGLVTLGSITRHQAFVQLDRPADAQRFVDRYHDRLRGMQISFETAEQQGEELAEAVSTLSRFLGLVGLTALLLGGLGVGSAVNVFVREKRAVIATLRCLGATQAQAFTAYLLQAALLGLAGATAGVVLGTLVQAVLPHLLQGALPFDVDFRVRPVPILSGLAVGLLVAVLFALLPLLEIRGITPLQAIRQEVEPVRRRFDPLRAGAWLLLAAGVTALAIWQAGDWRPGIAYAAAIATAILLLLVCASVLVMVTRRWFPERASFVVRQGIASLFRPHNQTTAVTVALGFGVFIISAMLLVQHNLVERFDVRALGSQPNLVGFGIQAGQRDSIAATLSAAGAGARIEPIVTARIAAINGVPVDSLLNSARARDIEPWALRREYRNTYRDTLTATETLIAGEWFDQEERGARGASRDVPARVSIEEGVAGSLDVGIGDRITWDLQGLEVESAITSVRQVRRTTLSSSSLARSSARPRASCCSPACPATPHAPICSASSRAPFRMSPRSTSPPCSRRSNASSFARRSASASWASSLSSAVSSSSPALSRHRATSDSARPSCCARLERSADRYAPFCSPSTPLSGLWPPWPGGGSAQEQHGHSSASSSSSISRCRCCRWRCWSVGPCCSRCWWVPPEADRSCGIRRWRYCAD